MLFFIDVKILDKNNKIKDLATAPPNLLFSFFSTV